MPSYFTNLNQLGLILDILGFLLIFFFGGFTLGLREYISSSPTSWALILRLAGCLLVVMGFVFQIIGAT